MNVQREKDETVEGPKAAFRRANQWLAVVAIALVIMSPFLLDVMSTPTSKVNVLAFAMIILPLVALLAYDQNMAIEHIVGMVGERLPRRAAERRRLVALLIFMTVAGSVQSAAVILSIRWGVIPAHPPSDSGIAFNLALIAVAMVVLFSKLELLKRMIFTAGPPILIALGRYHDVDPVKIALWQNVTTLLMLLILIRQAVREFRDLAANMVAEITEGDAEPDEASTAQASRNVAERL